VVFFLSQLASGEGGHSGTFGDEKKIMPEGESEKETVARGEKRT